MTLLILTATEGLLISFYFQPGGAGAFHASLHCTSQALFCWIKEATHSSLPMAKILNYVKHPYSSSLHL